MGAWIFSPMRTPNIEALAPSTHPVEQKSLEVLASKTETSAKQTHPRSDVPKGM
ncbi:hypothetical protein AMTRI_Chr01g135730 [Amborella trichopoda]